MEVYHLSKTKTPMLMIPRVPNNYFTMNGYEDNKIKRVCMSKSIDGALMAMSKNIERDEFYIHVPSTNVKVSDNRLIRDIVPDATLTGEVWILEEFTTKIIGKIQVGKAKSKPLIFTYGGDKTAELYEWSYRKINDSTVVREYMCMI